MPQGNEKGSGSNAISTTLHDKAPLDSVHALLPGTKPESSNLLYSLDFSDYNHSDEGPTFIDIMCLAQTLSDIAPEYRLYEYSCYWHARIFYEGMHKMFPRGRSTKGPASKKRGSLGRKRKVNDYGKLILPSPKRDGQTPGSGDDKSYLMQDIPPDMALDQARPGDAIAPGSMPFVVKPGDANRTGPSEDQPVEVVKEWCATIKARALERLNDPNYNDHCKEKQEERERKEREDAANRRAETERVARLEAEAKLRAEKEKSDAKIEQLQRDLAAAQQKNADA